MNKGNRTMHIKPYLLIPAAFLLTLVGCAKQLTNDLQWSFPLEYLHDSKICRQKSNVKIAIGNVESKITLPKSTYARASYYVPVPLLLLNFGVSSYSCRLGQSSVETDMNAFLYNEFAKEAIRSGSFKIVSDGTEDYTVDLTIINQETVSSYTKFFLMFAIAYVHGWSLAQKYGPAQSNVTLKMHLKGKDGRSVEKLFKSSAQEKLKRFKIEHDLRKFRRNCVIEMIESSSKAFKDCIEKTVSEIDQLIQTKKI